MDPVNNLRLPDFDLFLVLGMLFTIHGFLLRSKSKIFQYARLLPYLLSILRITKELLMNYRSLFME